MITEETYQEANDWATSTTQDKFIQNNATDLNKLALMYCIEPIDVSYICMLISHLIV